MKKSSSIRGCISCILPCGALDVIRIVHSNGRVEEITSPTLKAADVMRAHPKHVLKKPSSPNVLIVPPHADLRRGNIYFLVPLPSPLPTPNNNNNKSTIIRNMDNKHTRSRDRDRDRDRGRARLTIWRPHLDTISESPLSSSTSHHL